MKKILTLTDAGFNLDKEKFNKIGNFLQKEKVNVDELNYILFNAVVNISEEFSKINGASSDNVLEKILDISSDTIHSVAEECLDDVINLSAKLKIPSAYILHIILHAVAARGESMLSSFVNRVHNDDIKINEDEDDIFEARQSVDDLFN